MNPLVTSILIALRACTGFPLAETVLLHQLRVHATVGDTAFAAALKRLRGMGLIRYTVAEFTDDKEWELTPEGIGYAAKL